MSHTRNAATSPPGSTTHVDRICTIDPDSPHHPWYTEHTSTTGRVSPTEAVGRASVQTFMAMPRCVAVLVPRSVAEALRT